MKKLKKYKSNKRKDSMSGNRVLFATLAGAVTGLAITYLLESEKGRSLLSKAISSVKDFASDLKIPTLLKS